MFRPYLQIIFPLVENQPLQGPQHGVVGPHQLPHVSHHRGHLVVHQRLDVKQRRRKADLEGSTKDKVVKPSDADNLKIFKWLTWTHTRSFYKISSI